ncbi:DUF685 domain-containing protein [Borrelia puertoricensis]|uniref:DUF685 domain-containing protein n=1 Tax=Borrelia puertoricensis TaxID=2756107 RepID=UPI001FF3C29F|nr:DUF685 domain-containing protein [Borrelia puertoricensis]UPA18726.1 DUF685 domain-containing protein [Borrelia puertoricensis]
MSTQAQESVVKHDDTIEIKNLNKVTKLEPTNLLVLDDGFSSCHAITLDNFHKDLHTKIFIDDGDRKNDFKQVIKTLIANELLGDSNFINQVYSQVLTKFLNDDSSSISKTYSKVVEKLNNNESSVMDSIISKVTNKFESNLPEDNLSKSHYLIGLYYSSLKKIPVQEYLTGISNSFSVSSTTTIRATSYNSSDDYYRNTVYMSSLKYGRYVFKLGSTSTSNHEEIIIQTDSSYDDTPIYLIVKVDAISNSTAQSNKEVSIKYSYSSKRTLFRLSSVHGGTGFNGNILEGWYMQKNVSGSPLLVKL